MSISSVRSRIQEIQAEINSVRSKPTQMFGAVLQDKLNASGSSGGSDVSSDGLTELVPNEDMSQMLVNQLASSGNYDAGYAAYNSTCPECIAALNAVDTASAVDYAASLPEEFAGAAPYMEYIKEASERYGMPVNLIVGIMKAESNFNNECVSYAGAKGLMQLMPETAEEVGVTDVFDPRQNILGSVEYVTKLINRYDGDVRLALAAYNTGPGKIAQRGVASSSSQEYLTVPQSIRDYAERVLKYASYT